MPSLTIHLDGEDLREATPAVVEFDCLPDGCEVQSISISVRSLSEEAQRRVKRLLESHVRSLAEDAKAERALERRQRREDAA